MSKPKKDDFKKMHRVGKTKEQIIYKNVNFFDLIEDSYDEYDEDDEDDNF